MINLKDDKKRFLSTNEKVYVKKQPQICTTLKTGTKVIRAVFRQDFQNVPYFNFECRTENEKIIYQKVCNFVRQEGNEGVLLMIGAKETGKTHLGAAAVRDTQDRYISMEDLIYKVESSMNFKSPQTEEEVFNDYSTVKFLVIDEVGRSLKREKEIEILSYILRKRYDNQLPTIVISNLEKKVLMKNLGEAVVDSLRETATSIEFTGESYRILKRKVA